jgi:hypothetical protein
VELDVLGFDSLEVVHLFVCDRIVLLLVFRFYRCGLFVVVGVGVVVFFVIVGGLVDVGFVAVVLGIKVGAFCVLLSWAVNPHTVCLVAFVILLLT